MRSKNYQNLYLTHNKVDYKLDPGTKIDKRKILFRGEPMELSVKEPMYFIVQTNCIGLTKKRYFAGDDAKSANKSSEALKFSGRGIDGFEYSWFGLYTDRKENLSAIKKDGLLKGALKDFARLFYPEIEYPSLTHLRKIPAKFLKDVGRN